MSLIHHRTPYLSLAASLALSGFLLGCSANQAVATTPLQLSSEAAVSGESLKLLIASDLHYQPDPSDAASSLVPQIAYIDSIVDCLFSEAAALKPDALILCGDMTNNGRMTEHLALTEKLNLLSEQGIPTLVLPGNHDIKGVSKEEFSRLYQLYGFGDSGIVSRDTDSLSYAASLHDSLWLLMLDTNDGTTYGGISGETLRWMQTVTDDAARQDITVITASHHNLLGHSSDFYNKKADFNQKEALLTLFNQEQIFLNISGHLHKQHIAKTSMKNGDFYEIASAMIADYPNTFGLLSIDPVGRELSYQAMNLDIEHWAAKQNLPAENLRNFQEFSRESRKNQTERLIRGMLSSMDISGGDLDTLTSFWTGISLSSSEGTLAEKRSFFLSSKGYRLWQRYRDNSRYAEWLDFLMGEHQPDSRLLSLSY